MSHKMYFFFFVQATIWTYTHIYLAELVPVEIIFI